MFPYRYWPMVMLVCVFLFRESILRHVHRGAREYETSNNGVTKIAWRQDKKNSSSLWSDIKISATESRILTTSPYLFQCAKPPKDIRYLLRDNRIRSAMEDLYQLKHFDQDTLFDMVLMLEHFMKIHFNIVIGAYDSVMYMQVMKDTTSAIMEYFDILIYNTPKASTTLNIPDITLFIDRYRVFIQTILYQYIRVIKHKYRNECEHLIAFELL